jgi:hypothetical protein
VPDASADFTRGTAEVWVNSDWGVGSNKGFNLEQARVALADAGYELKPLAPAMEAAEAGAGAGMGAVAGAGAEREL